MHDFDASGKAIPYGIYDMGRNEAWVNSRPRHPRFAVASIRVCELLMPMPKRIANTLASRDVSVSSIASVLELLHRPHEPDVAFLSEVR